MSFISWVIKKIWPLLMNQWKKWGIEILTAASLVCQIILATLGWQRKKRPFILLRFIVWATYLLGTYVATVALGKLTVVDINNPLNPHYDVKVEGLLAPLLLMHLGHPDGITAYAVEDNRLGLRQILNVGITIAFVVWVLIRRWDASSPVSWLYFPLFVVGIIKSVGWVLALRSVYDENSSVTSEDINEHNLPALVKRLPPKLHSAKTILQAYHRFDILKPHLVNWLYHPEFTTKNWMAIDGSFPEEAFSMMEIELSFMYDVLYTKKTILYTSWGLSGRFLGFLCLVSTLCGFAHIKNFNLNDSQVIYTYSLLVAMTFLELYQIILLPLSDWAVVKMIIHHDCPLVQHILPKLADWCMKQKRWSRSIGKLNLLDGRLYEEWSKPIRMVVPLFDSDEFLRSYWSYSSQDIPLYLKKLVVEAIRKLEERKKFLPFTQRGERTLDIFDRNQSEKMLKNSIANPNTFDKSIIIWHIATEICHYCSHEESDFCHGSKLLSDYMMYLLALHPYMLSLTTANITLKHVFSKLKPFVRRGGEREAIRTLWSIEPVKETPMDDKEAATKLIRDWTMLTDAQKLVAELRGDPEDNKWKLISSMWVEMLCYAAYNCNVYQHAKMLRRGGELITHVWLLLAHNTDKYHSGLLDLTKDRSFSNPPALKSQKVFGCIPNLCAPAPQSQ